MRHALRPLSIVALGLSLTACDTLTRQAERETAARAEASDIVAASPLPPRKWIPADNVRVNAGVYLGRRAPGVPLGDNLPPDLETDRGIALLLADELPIERLAGEIAAASGIPVRIGLMTPPQGQGGQQSANASANRQTTRVRFVGPLSGLLNELSNRHQVSWIYENGEIEIFRYLTRNYTLYALPSDEQTENQITASVGGNSASGSGGSNFGGGSGGLSSGGGSSRSGSTAQSVIRQEYESETRQRTWREVREAIQNMLPSGARVIVSPSTATITVTATLPAIRAVQKYVEEQNTRFARQVHFTVTQIAFEANDDDTYGIDLQAAFREGINGVRAAFLGPAPALASEAGRVLVGILNPPPGSSGARFDGSNLVIQALSQRGRVTNVRSWSLFTLNGHTVPVTDVNARGYLAEVSQNQTANVGSQISLRPGTVVTGTTLQLTPRILANDSMLLEFALSRSNLNRLDSAGSGGQQIQVPDVGATGTAQKVALASGQTVILTGLQNAENRIENSGVGEAEFFGLGGRRTGRTGRSRLVIVLQPHVLKSPLLDRRLGEDAVRPRNG